MAKNKTVGQQLKSNRNKRQRGQKISNAVMSGPLTIWLAIFLLIPLAYIIILSVAHRGALGEVIFGFSASNYAQSASATYLKVAINTLKIAFWACFACVVLGYPFAYYIASKPKKAGTLLMLVMIPFMTSNVLRTFSWVLLLNKSGIVNHFLVDILGIIKEPLQMMYTSQSVMMCIFYVFLPYAVLPLYSSIEKMDRNLIEASADLGAKPYQTFFKVIIPQTSSGIMAAIMMTFIPALGVYFINDVVGGGTTMMLGNLIKDQFMSYSNYPFGAALSVLIMIIALVFLFLFNKLGGNMDDLGV